MLVGDIYGGRDYSSIGLSATTIASSFGKVVGQDKELADYNPAGARVCGLRNAWSFEERLSISLSCFLSCLAATINFSIIGRCVLLLHALLAADFPLSAFTH
jgi:hypothetical protein